jgi:hypothetical protein
MGDYGLRITGYEDGNKNTASDRVDRRGVVSGLVPEARA